MGVHVEVPLSLGIKALETRQHGDAEHQEQLDAREQDLFDRNTVEEVPCIHEGRFQASKSNSFHLIHHDAGWG
jgi:hypothetical protein